MLLSSRITIYHETPQSVSSAHCRFTPESALQSPGIDIRVSAGMSRWSLIKDQTDPGPDPDLWQIAQSLLVCQAQTFYQTQTRPSLNNIVSRIWLKCAEREKLNTDVFIYKMLARNTNYVEPALYCTVCENNLIWKKTLFLYAFETMQLIYRHSLPLKLNTMHC